MPRAEYDAQGKLFHHYVKVAGWSNERVNRLLMKRWNATHWMALDNFQKKAALSMMRSYAKASEKQQAKALRQRIMIMVKQAGYDLDWLHDAMDAWGAGRSLRALSFPQTVEVHAAVKALCKRSEVPADGADLNADYADGEVHTDSTDNKEEKRND